MHDIFVTHELMEDRGDDLIRPLLDKFGVKNEYFMPTFQGVVYELGKPLPKHIDILELPPQVHKELRMIRSGLAYKHKLTAKDAYGWTDPRSFYGLMADKVKNAETAKSLWPGVTAWYNKAYNEIK